MTVSSQMLSRLSTRTSAAVLVALGGLHALWATGSPWPFWRSGGRQASPDVPTFSRPRHMRALSVAGRRFYSPLCLALAVGALQAAAGHWR